MKALTVDWDLQIRVKKNDAGEQASMMDRSNFWKGL